MPRAAGPTAEGKCGARREGEGGGSGGGEGRKDGEEEGEEKRSK